MNRRFDLVRCAASAGLVALGLGASVIPAKAAGADVPSLFQWGPTAVHPSISYDYGYSDGLQATPGNPASSWTESVALAFAASLSDRWNVNYSPSWKFYSNPEFKNSVDQSASLSGAMNVGSCILSLAESYSLSTADLIATGAETRQESLSNELAGSDQLFPSLGLSGSLAETTSSANAVADGQRLPSNNSWAGGGRLSYRITNRTSASLGLNGSYADELGGANLSGTGGPIGHEQVLTVGTTAGLSWEAPNKKNSISLQGGVDRQVLLNGNPGGQTTPTYSLSTSYAPFTTTGISISAGESTPFSYLTDQTTVSKNYSVSLQQRLLGHFSLSAQTGGSQVSYASPDSVGLVARSDRGHSSSVSLSVMQFLRHGSASVSYQWSDNSSSVSEFVQSNRGVDFRVGYGY